MQFVFWTQISHVLIHNQKWKSVADFTLIFISSHKLNLSYQLPHSENGLNWFSVYYIIFNNVLYLVPNRKPKIFVIRIPYPFSRLCLLTQLYNCSVICPNITLSLMEEYIMFTLLESNSWGKHSFRNGINCFIVSLLLLALLFGV